MKKVFLFILSSCMFFLFTGCNEPIVKSKKTTQSQKAKQAADSIKFTENAEINNIKSRLELTSNPGLIGYVVLMNEAGQPVKYTSVKGKITSGGKRLTKPYAKIKCDKGEWSGDCITKAPSDEGTWGSSNPYIYFWDTNGAYQQWNGKYLYSNQPIRLSVKPLVIDIIKKEE